MNKIGSNLFRAAASYPAFCFRYQLRYKIPFLLSTGLSAFSYGAYLHYFNTIRMQEVIEKPFMQIQEKSKLRKAFSAVWSVILHFFRWIQLCIVFTPSIVLSPLLLTSWGKNYWMDTFVTGV